MPLSKTVRFFGGTSGLDIYISQENKTLTYNQTKLTNIQNYRPCFLDCEVR